MPATVDVTEKEVQVRFDRRALLPIVLASGLLDTAVEVLLVERDAPASNSLMNQ